MSISVALINYNNEKYLSEAIDSIVNQTRVPDEVVISDDGSTDQSIEIIRSYVDRFPFIKFVQTPKNLGAAGNRDFAIRHCTSDFFINLDSDDRFTPEVIEATEKALSICPDSVVISSFDVMSDSGDTLLHVDTSEFCQASHRRQIFMLSSRHRLMPGNQFAMSKDLYLRLGGLCPSLRLYEDWDFFLRLTQKRIAWKHSGKTGFSYRKSGTGLSSSGQLKHLKYRTRVILRNFIGFKSNPIYVSGIVFSNFRKGLKYLFGKASPIGYN